MGGIHLPSRALLTGAHASILGRGRWSPLLSAWKTRQTTQVFTRYRREGGLTDGTDYHSLRRSFLTLHEHRGTDYVAVARFVGHQGPTMMHAVYSAGASREALLKVADATRYSPEVERAVAGLE